MTKQIWKFPLNPGDIMFVEIPKDAEVLSVQTQGETPCMWALVDPGVEKEKRCFEVFGTGHSIYCNMGVERRFIGTFQLSRLSMVFHLFELLN